MARPARTSAKSRLNLEVSESVRLSLERLRVETGADSMTEVVRRALHVYDIMLKQARTGRIFVRRQDATEAEIVLADAQK